MKNFLLFFVFILISSCANHFSINPRLCKVEGQFAERKEARQFEFEYVVTHFGSLEHEVFLKDVLKKGNVSCDVVQNISYQSKQKWNDSLMDLVPFVIRKRFVITGNLIPQIKDDIKATDRR